MPNMHTGWRWTRPRARSCGCSALPDGRSTGSSRDARACTNSSTQPHACASVLVFWWLGADASAGRISLGEAVVYVQSAIGVSMIAFGGFSWALDGAAAPVAAVLRLEPAMRVAGALRSGVRPADRTPAREIRLRDVTFSYPGAATTEG